MEIKFRGKYQRRLFFFAVRLANQTRRNQRWLQPIMLLFILGALAVLINRLITSGDILGNASYIAVVMIVAGFLISSNLQPILAARKLWANKNLQQEFRGKVFDQGVEYRLKQGKNLIPWSRIQRIRKAKSLTTLVTRDGLLLVFPRYFFSSDTDWQKFNHIVDNYVVSM